MKGLIFKLTFVFTTIFAFTLSASEKVVITTTTLDLKEVFFASPIIYSILFTMSVIAFAIWLYSIFSFRVKDNVSNKMIKDLRSYLTKNEYEKALAYCKSKNNLFSSIVASGISSRAHGPQFMINTMKSSGQRVTVRLWQRLALLNDIVIIAPMLGLLGTVIGMFYAFYDMNRSIDSVASLFDGLGIAVGTTVAGLVVAIIAMIFHATLKYRLIKMLNSVENEAVSLGHLIEGKAKAKRRVKKEAR